jgi:hypothetical protein
VGRLLELSFGGATTKFGSMLTEGTEIADEFPEPSLDAAARAKQMEEELAKTQEHYELKKDKILQHLDSILPDQKPLGLPLVDEETLAIRKVFEAFEKVEYALDLLGKDLDVKARGATLMGMLVRRGRVPSKAEVLYTKLRSARNAMAHGETSLPNDAEALEFVRQADALNAILIQAWLKPESD